MNTYFVDIYVKYKNRFELYDSDIIVTDKEYEIIPIQVYKYNKNITIYKYTNKYDGTTEKGSNEQLCLERSKTKNKWRNSSKLR